MRPRALLVDGFNLIRRIYEARPDGADNLPDVIRSATQSLERARSLHQPSHALVVFETHAPTWRHECFPDYKANRKPTPPPLMQALPDFEVAFENTGVKNFTLARYETDDVIATLAHGISSANGTAILLSTDKAYLQLLNDNIRVFNHFEGGETTSADVLSRFGVGVNQLTDYWALVGDTTNNIKGVPKVGPKSARKLLEQYQTLDAILAAPEPDAAAARVQANAEAAQISKELVTLKTNVTLGINLKSFRLALF